MDWVIRFHPFVLEKDFAVLSREMQKRILDGIENKLSSNPEVFGKPLSSGLKGYRKLRVGDYRVVYELVGREVRILVIAHRREVYEEAHQRLE